MNNLKDFFGSMAGQFRAGIELAKNNPEAENAVFRDIDSFIVEARRWFPKQFDENEFMEIINNYIQN